MKEIFKIVKEHIVLLLGAGLFSYGLFSFSSGFYHVGASVATHYYYNQDGLILLTTGVILIVIGLLEIRKK